REIRAAYAERGRVRRIPATRALHRGPHSAARARAPERHGRGPNRTGHDRPGHDDAEHDRPEHARPEHARPEHDGAGHDGAERQTGRNDGARVMSSQRRGARLFIVLLSLALALAAGFAYPLLAQGRELFAATWQARYWLLALVAVPWVLWRGTWGSDPR